MTNAMTLRRRAAACLVASAGVLLVWAAGDAQAAPPDRELRSVLEHGAPGGKQIGPNRISWPRAGVTLTLTRSGGTYDRCKRQYVCLFQDAKGMGRMIWFKRYGRYKLAAYGMGPDPVHHRNGVSSFYNYQSGGARATLIGPNFRLGLADYGNVPRSMNDRATYVRLFP